MNEITNIHLGRQPFTIANDAYKALQLYLHEIKRQAGKNGDEVSKEVELRMAELLAERGIAGEKVVLVEDVDYLKQQLGEPRDFKDDEDESGQDEPDVNARRRLFRDTEHGMLAGVAAGLAAYTGVPALIFRLLFVALTFSGAIGILLYVLLWLLLPEAKTPSDRLQMKGMAVTVETLKKAVEQADIEGVANRFGRAAGRSGMLLAKIIMAIIGACFIVISFGLLAGATVAATYLLSHGLKIGTTTIFPVGSLEVAVVVCGVAVLTSVAVMFAIAGRSMAVRKWKVSGWLVAAIACLFIVAAGSGVGLGLNAAPAIQARYGAQNEHQMREVPAFTAVHVKGAYLIPVSFVSDSRYGVELQYAKNVDVSKFVTPVADGTLTVDATDFANTPTCKLLCPNGLHNIMIMVHAPSDFSGVAKGDDDGGYTTPVPPFPARPPAAAN